MSPSPQQEWAEPKGTSALIIGALIAVLAMSLLVGAVLLWVVGGLAISVRYLAGLSPAAPDPGTS